jgi:hypothetical protein
MVWLAGWLGGCFWPSRLQVCLLMCRFVGRKSSTALQTPVNRPRRRALGGAAEGPGHREPVLCHRGRPDGAAQREAGELRRLVGGSWEGFDPFGLLYSPTSSNQHHSNSPVTNPNRPRINHKVINPWGVVIARFPTLESTGIITADLDLAELARVREKMPIDEHRDRGRGQYLKGGG